MVSNMSMNSSNPLGGMVSSDGFESQSGMDFADDLGLLSTKDTTNGEETPMEVIVKKNLKILEEERPGCWKIPSR